MPRIISWKGPGGKFPDPNRGFSTAPRITSISPARMRAGGVDLAYKQTVLADGPVGYWRMDAVSGATEVDLSGNNLAGTIVGGVTYNAVGALPADDDRALTFDGSSGYVTMGDVALLRITAAISVEVWAKFPAGHSFPFIMGKGNYNGDGVGYYLFGSGTGIRWSARPVAGPTMDIQTTGVWNDNVYHHIVAVWDGLTTVNGAKIYIDGVQNAQGTSPVVGAGTPAVPFRLGVSSDTLGTADYYFPGTLDEAAVYAKVLTAAQAAAHYAARTTVPMTVTISGYNFRNCPRGDAPTVLFAGLPATNVVVVNANTITCNPPVTAPPGVVDVTVTVGCCS